MSDEVQLTQAIKDQALLLNYDPVKIYHWVRNNIEWQPTWGAIQDAELTLDAKRGNAMDIASLTISLLRASQIPARYVHGTITVPIESFNNWAGGFTSSDASVDFAASGGIPIRAGVAQGKITTAQMEHVWVEAAIDYLPSRGAVNNAADSWVQMDPSYKQYEYLTGLDAVAISGVDANQLATDFLASGTINETEGWISGFDPTVLEAAQTQAQTALENHITNNLSNPTVGDVIGGRKTIIQEFPILPSSLSNRIVVEGARYDKLPSQLQQQVTYSLGNDLLGNPVNPTTFSYSSLNNEKVTLSFRPATADDEAALLALLPEGDITDVNQLPSSIPSHLIEVIPELKVNGVLKISGQAMKLGEELSFNTSITFPGRNNPTNHTYNVIAGSYLSVNVIAGSVSPSKLSQLQAQLTATKAKLESSDPTQIASLTRQEILGDMFYTGSLGYFAQLIALSQITGLSNNAHYIMAAGLGTFGYEPKVDYLYGFPTGIQPGGIALDIPMNIVTATNDGNKENKKNFVIQVGVLSSALEHAVPEQMFSDPANPTQAISAVKALQIAANEGQRIYQIDQSNIDTVMPLLNLSGTSEAEILASVNAGLEVITHTDQVSVPGYTGEGFIVVDPLTGSGAYKIGGGGNGGFAALLTAIALILLTAVVAYFLVTATAITLSIIGMINIALSLIDVILGCKNLDMLVVFGAVTVLSLASMSAAAVGVVAITAFKAINISKSVATLSATIATNLSFSYYIDGVKNASGCK